MINSYGNDPQGIIDLEEGDLDLTGLPDKDGLREMILLRDYFLPSRTILRTPASDRNVGGGEDLRRLEELESKLSTAWSTVDQLSSEYVDMWRRLQKLEVLLFMQQNVIGQLNVIGDEEESDREETTRTHHPRPLIRHRRLVGSRHHPFLSAEHRRRLRERLRRRQLQRRLLAIQESVDGEEDDHLSSQDVRDDDQIPAHVDDEESIRNLDTRFETESNSSERHRQKLLELFGTSHPSLEEDIVPSSGTATTTTTTSSTIVSPPPSSSSMEEVDPRRSTSSIVDHYRNLRLLREKERRERLLNSRPKSIVEEQFTAQEEGIDTSTSTTPASTSSTITPTPTNVRTSGAEEDDDAIISTIEEDEDDIDGEQNDSEVDFVPFQEEGEHFPLPDLMMYLTRGEGDFDDDVDFVNQFPPRLQQLLNRRQEAEMTRHHLLLLRREQLRRQLEKQDILNRQRELVEVQLLRRKRQLEELLAQLVQKLEGHSRNDLDSTYDHLLRRRILLLRQLRRQQEKILFQQQRQLHRVVDRSHRNFLSTSRTTTTTTQPSISGQPTGQEFNNFPTLGPSPTPYYRVVGKRQSEQRREEEDHKNDDTTKSSSSLPHHGGPQQQRSKIRFVDDKMTFGE